MENVAAKSEVRFCPEADIARPSLMHFSRGGTALGVRLRLRR